MSEPETNFIILANLNKEGGVKDWVREIAPSAWVRRMSEVAIDDYSQKMNILRDTHKKISDWTLHLSDLVKEIKNSWKANRLVDLAMNLQDLNNTLISVVDEGKVIQNVQEKALREFDKENNRISRNAGFFDDMKRNWVANKMETKERAARKKALLTLIVAAQACVNKVNVCLDTMGKFKASGDIGKYVDELKKIASYQKEFQKTFIPIYSKYLKNLVDEVLTDQNSQLITKDAPIESVPEQAQEMVQELPKEQEVLNNVNKSEPEPEAQAEVINNAVEHNEFDPEEIANTTSNLLKEQDEKLKKLEDESKVASAALNLAQNKMHRKFLNELTALAEVDVKEAANFMISYSKKIAALEPEKSLELLAVAEGFLDE